MADLAGRKYGKYQLVERLGRGGMADVYKAYQPGMDRFVAVKLMHGHLAESADFVERFKREAQSVGQLRHPHILQVIDFDVEADVYYMVMEFIKGETLKSYIEHKGALPVDEVLMIVEQLADALAYAHQHHMVHRDIKPANVMFIDDKHQHVVLTDFGIARLLGESGMTVSGAFIGTPAYMSPEAGRGEKVDERADIYSLGIMLYEMLTGRVPYDADTPFAVVMKHVNEPLPPVRRSNMPLPDEVEKVLLKALAKDQTERFQSAADLKAAVARARTALASGESVPRSSETRSGIPTPILPSMQVSDGTLTPTGSSLYTPGGTLVDNTLPPAKMKQPDFDKNRAPAPSRKFPVYAAGAAVMVIVVAAVLGLLVFGNNGDSDDNDNRSTNADIGGQQVAFGSTSTATAQPTADLSSPSGAGAPTLEAEVPTAAGSVPSNPEPTELSEVQPSAQPPSPTSDDSDASEPPLGSAETGNEPPSEEVEVALASAAELLDSGDYAAAETAFTEVIELDPDLADAYAGRGYARSSQGEANEAIEDFTRVVELDPTNGDAFFTRGDLYHFINDNERALADYDRSIELQPDAGYVYTSRAWALYGLERYDEALETANQAVELSADDANAYDARGEIYLVLENPTAALEDFNRAIELAPAQSEFYTKRANAYLMLEQWEEAVSDFTVALEAFPDSEYLMAMRGNAQSELGNFEAAVEDFNSAIAISSGNPDLYPQIYADLGFAYESLGRNEAALSAYQRYLNQAGDNADPEVVAQVAEMAGEAGPVETRVEGLGTLGETLYTPFLDSDDPAVIERANQISDTDFEQGREAALALANTSLEEFSDNPILLKMRFELLFAMQDPAALQDAENAVAVHPEHPAGYLALAQYYFESQEYDYEKAFQNAETAYNLAPEQQQVVARYADALYRMGRPEEAVDFFNKAETVGAPWWDVLYRRSSVYEELGRWQEALNDYLRILDIDPNQDAVDDAVDMYLLLNRPQDALALAQEWLQYRNDWAYYADIAYIAYRAGNDDLAREWANTALAFNGDAFPAYYALALVETRAGNYEAAANDFAVIEDREEWEYTGNYLTIRNGQRLPLDQARLYAAMGDVDQALSYFDAAIQEVDWWYLPYLERARMFASQGSNPEAVNDYLVAIDRLDNDDPMQATIAEELFGLGIDVTRDVARGLLEANDRQSVIGATTLALQHYPNDPELLAYRALAYIDEDQFENGLADAQAAVAADATNPMGNVALSYYYSRTDDYDQMLSTAEQAYEIGPDYQYAILALINALRNTGSEDTARILDLYSQAEEAGADPQLILTERVDFATQIGEYEVAVDDYSRLLEIAPEPWVIVNLASTYLLLDQPEAAFDVAEENSGFTIEDPESQASFLADLAYVAYAAEENDSARQWLDQAAEIDASLPKVVYVNALLAAREGDYQTATTLLQTLESVETWRYSDPFLNLSHRHTIQLDLARAFAGLGDEEQARAYYQQIPYDASYFLERADYYISIGDTEAAREDLLQAESITDDTELQAQIRQRIIDLGPRPTSAPN